MDPINYLYIMGSTKSEEKSLKDFRFITIHVVMNLQSIILYLYIISIVYFPWLRKISSGPSQNSNPNKYCIKPKSFISNY